MNAAEILDLASRVARLAPSHRDPERFHLEKSELADTLKRWAADMRSVPASRRALPLPSRPPRTPPVASPLPARPTAPSPRPTHQRPFCDDPTASSFLAWIILVGAHEVSLGEVRKATSLSLFAATCLLARFADAGIVAKVRLPPRGAGRGRPKVRWRVDGARLASLLRCDEQPARPAPAGHRWGVAAE